LILEQGPTPFLPGWDKWKR